MGKVFPPFRIDIAGALYVPFALRDARRQYQDGQISRQVLRAVENAEIRNLAERLKSQGMQVVTDGGFRSYDFLEGWEGIRCKGGVGSLSGGDLEVTGRISLLYHPVLDDFVFLAENIAEDVLPKQHMPSPGKLLMRILDPLLIFGVGPFPAMGIEGAAIATGLGQVFNLVFYLIVYKMQPLQVRLSRKYLHPDRALIARLYSVGIPGALNLALPSVLVSALNGLLAAYSQSYVVILGIYYKLQTFLYLPASGIVQGMRPVIGYNYGAGEHKRVKKIYYVTLCMSGVIMLVGTIICLTVPGQLMGMFTTNPETIAAGKTALRIICAGFLVSSVSVTACGALEGLGKGTASLVVSLCRYLIIILPAAFILSRILGAVGVWHAFWIAEALTAGVAFFISQKVIGV